MLRKATHTLVLIIGILTTGNAQNSQVLYYMNLPQNHLLNPALRPSNSFYFGIPALTGINLSINNNFFNLSDILIPGQADSVITFLHPDYNVDEFLAKIKDKNFLAPKVNIQLFGLGFRVAGDLYIFMDIADRIEGNIVLPGDLVRLGLKGNEDFIGKTIDLSPLDADIRYFREYSLGFSKDITKNLRIGARLKMLFGIANLSLDNRSLGLTVNDDFSHTINADLSANISGPVTVFFDADNRPDSVYLDKDVVESAKFFLNTSNRGFGIDVGATYRVSEKIVISAGLNNFGFIKWKDRVTNMKAESQFLFSGFNISDVVDGTKTFDELAEEMLDSLKNSFIISDDNNAFSTYFPVGLTFGGSYNLTRSFSLGLLSHSLIYQKQFRETLTLSANLNLGDAFSTSLSYTAANNRYDNIGAGLAFRAGFFQIYLLADRIPVKWDRIIANGKKIPLPSSLKTVNLTFGLNLTFGNVTRKYSDKPMLLEQNPE